MLLEYLCIPKIEILLKQRKPTLLKLPILKSFIFERPIFDIPNYVSKVLSIKLCVQCCFNIYAYRIFEILLQQKSKPALRNRLWKSLVFERPTFGHSKLRTKCSLNQSLCSMLLQWLGVPNIRNSSATLTLRNWPLKLHIFESPAFGISKAD